MPLPDERPRQSVANLIGRFEKRASVPATAASPGSRPSSVVSHTTGDSQKAEAREKREWPPASAAAATSTATSPDTTSPSREVQNGSASLSHLQEKIKLLSVSSEDEPVEVPKPTASPEPLAPMSDTQTLIEPAEAAAPVPIPAKDTLTKKQQPPAKSMTRSVTATPKPGPRSSTPRATPSKPISSTPARAAPLSKAVPTPKPLKPQHTGTSTISTASTARERPRAGAKSPLTTRAGAKTPTAARPVAPASSTTTATLSVPRPKTPGSDRLYAPTKASLARSKNAQEVPVPVRKPTIPASSLDRLSKPTAASASKVRTPVVSPPRPSVAKSARGAPPTRGMMKPRIGLAGARTQKRDGAVPANGTKVAPSVNDKSEKSTTSSIDQSSHSAPFSDEGQSNDGAVSEIESYDDAFASDEEGIERLSLDNAHIKTAVAQAGADDLSFSFTPEAVPVAPASSAPSEEEHVTEVEEEKAEANQEISEVGTPRTEEHLDLNGHAEDAAETKVETEADPETEEVLEEAGVKAEETVEDAGIAEETSTDAAVLEEEVQEEVIEQPTEEEEEEGVANGVLPPHDMKEHITISEPTEVDVVKDEQPTADAELNMKASRPVSMIGSETPGSIPDED